MWIGKRPRKKIRTTTIRKTSIKQKTIWDTVQPQVKYEIQYGCQTDAHHITEHKTARAEQAPWSQPDVLHPAWTLPWQKGWESAWKTQGSSARAVRGLANTNYGKNQTNLHNNLSAWKKSCCNGAVCFLCHKGMEMLGLNCRGNNSISISRKK